MSKVSNQFLSNRKQNEFLLIGKPIVGLEELMAFLFLPICVYVSYRYTPTKYTSWGDSKDNDFVN